MIRPAVPADARACAAILNNWIDETPWMPRVHPPEDVLRYTSDVVLPTLRVWVADDPARGYLGLDETRNCITTFYVAAGSRGKGLGRALLNTAKRGRDTLWLWTFEANTPARRFYEAHGFEEEGRSDGDNEENLPDIRYRWRA